MNLFRRKISFELVLGFWFLSDAILFAALYENAHYKMTCAAHATVTLVLSIFFLARGFAAWQK